MKGKTKSFTLLELIIVVVILGILASISIPIYTNAVNKQKGNVTISNIRLIIAAEKIYKMKNNNFWPLTTESPKIVSDAEINTALRTEITEKYFVWGGKDYYLINIDSTSFEIRTCASWISPLLYICVKWNPSNNKINWKFASTGYPNLADWFNKYPDTLPDDHDTSA